MKILRAEISGALRHFLRLFLIELVHFSRRAVRFCSISRTETFSFPNFLEIRASSGRRIPSPRGEFSVPPRLHWRSSFLFLRRSVPDSWQGSASGIRLPRGCGQALPFSRSSVIRFCLRVVRTSSNDSSCSLISSFALLMM